MRHLLECAVILIWVFGVCGMPFWVYVACFVYPGVSLAVVRSFAEHRAEQAVGKRTAIVENARIPRAAFPVQQPACCAPARQATLVSNPEIVKQSRSLIERNGGLVYNSYFDVARRHSDIHHARFTQVGTNGRRERRSGRYPAYV